LRLSSFVSSSLVRIALGSTENTYLADFELAVETPIGSASSSVMAGTF
jgi:hypothetical protein